MGWGRGTGWCGARVAVPVAGCLVAAGMAVGPAVADPTSTSTVPTVSTPTVSTPTVSTGPGASMATVVPPNQTKILGVDPSVAPPTAVPAAATPRPPTSASPAAAASAPAETAATVSADSPGLRALVGLTTADQRRVDAGIARSESDVATLRAAFDAAQAELTARQGDEQAAQAAVDAAQGDLAGADSRLAAMELAAVSAADAVGRRRTPVASPPSPGHTPLDAAVQARQDLIAATADRDRRRATLDDRGHDLDRAQQAQADAAQVFTARADDLQQGLDALDQARQELSPTASDSAAALRPAPTALATATIPADYLALYGRAAATCSGLSWLVLAGIGSVESAHGTSGAAGVHAGANVAGAMGPMQFLAGTWATYGADGDGDGVRDVYNPADAIFGAARYLCASGAGDISTLRRALWAYNHADWYVEQVLQIAARY